MDINKLDLFITELEEMGIDQADKAFDHFKQEWPHFSQDERKILSGVVTGMMLRFTEGKAAMKAKLYWLAIANYSEKRVMDGKVIEDDDEYIFPRLELAEGIKVNRITKMFSLLIKEGTIVSSIDLVAEALSIIFRVEESTAYNDLTQPSRIAHVKLPPPFNDFFSPLTKNTQA